MLLREKRTKERGSGQLGMIPLSMLLTILFALVALSAMAAIGLGPVSISPTEVMDTVYRHIFVSNSSQGPNDFIVWQLRTPRVVQGVFVGAGLAVAGLLTQAMVRNPLGEPHILGLTSGAAVGSVLVITVSGSAIAGLLTVPLAAFCGALVTAIVVFALSRVRASVAPARMIMAGISIGQLLSGVVSLVLLSTKDSDAQQQILFWILGSLAGAQWPLALTSALIVLLLILISAMGTRWLNLLVLGDNGAAALGVNVTRLRTGILLVVTLLTGTVVAVSGSIGFVGLIVPNLTRLLVGADHRRALPVAALLGAFLVVWADTAARLVLAPSELPIGILTAAIGVPFFLFVLRRNASESVGLA